MFWRPPPSLRRVLCSANFQGFSSVQFATPFSTHASHVFLGTNPTSRTLYPMDVVCIYDRGLNWGVCLYLHISRGQKRWVMWRWQERWLPFWQTSIAAKLSWRIYLLQVWKTSFLEFNFFIAMCGWAFGRRWLIFVANSSMIKGQNSLETSSLTVPTSSSFHCASFTIWMKVQKHSFACWRS